MEEQDSSVGVAKSPLSCRQCRRLKRRCDRQYPCCNLCEQKQLVCDYPHQRKKRVVRAGKGNHQEFVASTSNSNSSSATVSPQSYDTDTPLSKSQPNSSTKVNAHHQLAELSKLNPITASFLDADNVALDQLETAKIDVTITKHVADLVGSVDDIQNAARTYWASVHLWMPIVSKIQFRQHLLPRLVAKRAQLFLLILAMKLLSTPTKTSNSMLYRTVKQLYFDVELAGSICVMSLQAGTLIAVYELGHGIYPAAIVSVAHCARIGTLIGVDKALANDLLSQGIPWVELEERRRLWWAILIFVNLSCPKQSLVTLDPDPESKLPVDDDDYDNGTSTPGDSVPLRLSSQVHLGRFARFVHAVPLLSQAIRRSNEDRHSSAQLRRTILSLIHLGETESVEDRILFCTLNAVCYLAVFALDRPPRRPNTQQLTVDDIASPETVAAIDHAIRIMTSEASNHSRPNLSPFVLHMMYRALNVSWRLQNLGLPGVDVSSNVERLKLGLKCFQDRWLVANTYLLLAKRQEVFSVT
ncbi:hypothetical protein NLG97_g2247 [Lecanicillium saksenae]|uniref:Uncharacterized protein n=1 Tax=Lecanicillium saksenae TaxID=468837 RepID=A0ACC1R243_9HYPO|nr:hypothetical protein NLG97_g2247 [Lecanicillium saksenae]